MVLRRELLGQEVVPLIIRPVGHKREFIRPGARVQLEQKITVGWRDWTQGHTHDSGPGWEDALQGNAEVRGQVRLHVVVRLAPACRREG
ncbi:hypothetical protein GCM10010844_00310 [Deinococcus radiotolerans]|uniref:Uncharacterized protein n=1 Tax=Deinococcus radiotolerans TaxID=1309407 RepID=A0ABQ2FFB7_9DEIO|nr:hypothetical protein GCM10010844_00310 [Deinococcus radiotolerans]